MFPSLDIHPSPPPGILQAADVGHDSAESSVSCEMDYQQQCETVQVVSDLMSTTVSIDPGGTVGGAWVVESKSR